MHPFLQLQEEGTVYEAETNNDEDEVFICLKYATESILSAKRCLDQLDYIGRSFNFLFAQNKRID